MKNKSKVEFLEELRSKGYTSELVLTIAEYAFTCGEAYTTERYIEESKKTYDEIKEEIKSYFNQHK